MTNPPTTTQTQHLAGGPAAPHDHPHNLSRVSDYLEAVKEIVGPPPYFNRKMERKCLKTLRELTAIDDALEGMGHRVDWIDPSLCDHLESAAQSIHKMAREAAYFLAQYEQHSYDHCPTERAECGCFGCVKARDDQGQIISVEMVKQKGAQR